MTPLVQSPTNVSTSVGAVVACSRRSDSRARWSDGGEELQSNNENREHQKYFWNVIVLQEKRREKTEPQARTLISLCFCGLLTCPNLCCDLPVITQ